MFHKSTTLAVLQQLILEELQVGPHPSISTLAPKGGFEEPPADASWEPKNEPASSTSPVYNATPLVRARLLYIPADGDADHNDLTLFWISFPMVLRRSFMRLPVAKWCCSTHARARLALSSQKFDEIKLAVVPLQLPSHNAYLDDGDCVPFDLVTSGKAALGLDPRAGPTGLAFWLAPAGCIRVRGSWRLHSSFRLSLLLCYCFASSTSCRWPCKLGCFLPGPLILESRMGCSRHSPIF